MTTYYEGPPAGAYDGMPTVSLVDDSEGGLTLMVAVTFDDQGAERTERMTVQVAQVLVRELQHAINVAERAG